jgi:hypothetical protein
LHFVAHCSPQQPFLPQHFLPAHWLEQHFSLQHLVAQADEVLQVAQPLRIRDAAAKLQRRVFIL